MMGGDGVRFADGRRKGATILEAVISLVVLSTITTILVQTMGLLLSQQRSVHEQTLAREEAANLMEQAFALSWEELNDETTGKWRVSDELLLANQAAKLAIEIESLRQPLVSKRIEIVITLVQPNERPSETVKLVAWRYQSESAQ